MGMKWSQNSRDFTPAPEGNHLGVLVDIRDLGEQDSPWGKKNFVKLVYQIDELMEDGQPFIVSGRFNATLAPRSGLRKHIETIRDKPFTAKELEDFESDELIGTNAVLNIKHNTTEKDTYANIASVMAYDSRFGEKLVPNYVREQDRPNFGTQE
jgi:hypothetical protein